MIEIQRIKENRAEVIAGLKKRGLDSEKDIEKILIVDQQWRDAKTELQETSANLNTISKEVGKLFGSGERNQAEALKIQSVELKKQEVSQKARVEELQVQLSKAIMALPNILRPEVPSGKDAEDNELIFESGSSPTSESAPKPTGTLLKNTSSLILNLG